MTTAENANALLDAACKDVDSLISRTDNKASLLFALNIGVLAGIAGLADKNWPLPAQLVGGGGVFALAASTLMLLNVVQPDLGGRSRNVHEGFVLWADLEGDALRAAVTQDTRVERVGALSRIAKRKFQYLRRAIHLIRIAFMLLLAAAAWMFVAG